MPRKTSFHFYNSCENTNKDYKDCLSATAPSSTRFYLEELGTNVQFALCKQAMREDYGLADSTDLK